MESTNYKDNMPAYILKIILKHEEDRKISDLVKLIEYLQTCTSQEYKYLKLIEYKFVH